MAVLLVAVGCGSSPCERFAPEDCDHPQGVSAETCEERRDVCEREDDAAIEEIADCWERTGLLECDMDDMTGAVFVGMACAPCASRSMSRECRKAWEGAGWGSMFTDEACEKLPDALDQLDAQRR